jgi:hypothetical protein
MFARAATIAYEFDPAGWVDARCSLASALRVAAEWPGASAMDDAANAYRTVLNAIARDADPEFWASVNLEHADALAAIGSDDCSGEAVRAVERALQVVTAQTDAVRWADVQVRLGEVAPRPAKRRPR